MNKILNLFTATEIDEWKLEQLCDRLTRLNVHFQQTISYFSLPITFNLASNAFMLIGSACFMIINQDNLNIQPSVASFIFCIGLFALVRLVVICSVGNMASGSCQALSRLIYQSKYDWTVQEWMCYLEIKRFAKQFSVCLNRIVLVQQSSILTMLGL